MPKIPTEDIDSEVLDAIRQRVLARHAELQKEQNHVDETNANIEALEEVTLLSREEILRIAEEVKAGFANKTKKQPVVERSAKLQIMFGKDGKKGKKKKSKDERNALRHLDVMTLTDDQVAKKRKFKSHLFTYVMGNTALMIFNAMAGEEPVFLIAALLWGIGLGRHYLTAVRWPKSDLKNAIREIKSEILDILDENWPVFGQPGKRRTKHLKPYVNAIYRLLLSGASNEELIEYLTAVEVSINGKTSPISLHEEIALQLSALRRRFARKPEQRTPATDVDRKMPPIP